MLSKTFSKNLRIISLAAIVLAFLFLQKGGSATLAQNNAEFIRQVRAFDVDNIGILNPVGLAYSPGANEFLVLEAGGPSQPPSSASDIIRITPVEVRLDPVAIAAAIDDPINMVFDNKAGRLLLIDSATNELIQIKARPDGTLDPATLTRHDAQHFGLMNPQGMTIDLLSGTLFILDNTGPQLVRVEPGSDQGFDNAQVSAVDLSSTGLEDIRGLAFDPTTGHLYVYSSIDQELTELTQTGQVLATRDMSEFDYGTLQGMVFAPSGDQTDDPSQMNLFIADSGSGAGLNLVANSPNNEQSISANYQIFLPLVMHNSSGNGSDVGQPGTIIEFSFIEPILPRSATSMTTFQSTLVQTINAWQWSPPSPDTSGIVYLESSGTLLTSDGEVNEMTIPPNTVQFTGDNLFESTINGVLTDTLTTITFSDEPTGVALNPANKHLFFSDDTGTRTIYELNPGLDGLYNTPDDIVTSFPTGVFGSSDPEGVTYASSLGALFIVDGLNREIYQVTPGANGFFDGVDDQVSNFDTLGMGLNDPEGIAYNSDTGNLYIVGSPPTMLFEVTTGGTLVQMIDISVANADKPAGLAYAPSSLDPLDKHIYIAARGKDNNTDPSENDGMIYEVTLPPNNLNPVPPVANDDIVATNVDMPVIIDVAANDIDPNANLDPTTVNNTCIPTCSAPTNGTLNNNGDGSFTYTPGLGFLGNDSFIYEICDTDGLCDTAAVSITVTIPTNTIDVRVAASSDDAEQRATGAVKLTSGDLELVFDKDLQTVGLRFNGINIPPGSTILNATIQFQADEANSEVTDLTIQGEASDNTATFVAASGNISSRPRTTAAVSWSPAPWPTKGVAGPDQQTPNIAPVIQEIVNRPGWANGNSLAIIITGTGKRVAESFDGAGGPLLHVEYTSSGNQPPTVSISAPANGATFIQGDNITFTGTASDFEDGDLTASLGWTSNLDGTIGNGGSFSRSDLSVGSHIITATVTDNDGQTTFNSVTINVLAPGTEIFVGAGDIAECGIDEDEATAQLLDNIPGTVFTVGDNAYPDGTDADFNNCYEPTWGRHKARTYPALGDNEYNASPVAAGHFNYFGAVAGNPGEGYYSFDLGGWHIIVLNSNCSRIGGCGPNDPQGLWLQADLATNPSTCTLAIHHEPLFSSSGGDIDLRDFWVPLYGAGADIVLSGHRHNYERFAQQNPDGVADPGRGIRQFVVGTGGSSLSSFGPVAPNSEVRNNTTHGVMKLTLHPTSYDWEFIPIAGQTFTDSGSENCVVPPAGNQPPNAVDDSANTPEDTLVTIDVAANDSDVDGNLDPTTANTTCATCTGPISGILANNGNGTFDYTPNLNFNGGDNFIYEICDTLGACDTATVTITVNPANDPPVAGDDSANTSMNTAVLIDVAANDSDLDGNLDLASANTTCATCSGPANGSLFNNLDGTFNYTPTLSYIGLDNFVYEICDNGNPSLCDTATVSITVTVANDPPVAVDDSASTPEDTPVTFDVAANDSDVDGNLDPASSNTVCATCTGTTNGTLANNGNGTFDYTPNLNFNGGDNFVYEICDTLGACDTATVTITVNPVNDPPLAINDSPSTPEDTLVTIDVAANDIDPDGNLNLASTNNVCATCTGPANGNLVNNGNGTFDYTPNPGFSGGDNFVYEICDSGSPSLCDTAVVTIAVNPVNDPPVAIDDSTNTPEDTPVTIDVAANDSDLDGNLDPTSTNTLCATCSGPTSGILVNNGNGTFDYTPNLNFNGGDNFVYEICDSGVPSLCDTALVTITVNPVNDPPLAINDGASTAEGTLVTIDVATNDSDPEGNLNPASTNNVCATCTGPANGNLVNNGDGTFFYTPNPGFNGGDSFVYEICDSGSPILCSTAGVSITVNPAAPTIFEVRVANGFDDAEESSTGGVGLGSSDLEMVLESSLQTVGMRFNGVVIPPGATILSAYIQFQADEANSEATSLTIQGEDSDNAATFVSANGNVSGRPRTTASTTWAPVPWLIRGEAGPAQQTSDIASVVQEIVNRTGWSSGNSLAVIVTGTGKRVAESYDGVSTAAPLLHVEYNAGPPNNPPIAADDNASTPEDTLVTIDVAANDIDPEGSLDLASANTNCATCAGPANGSLVNNGDGGFDYTPDPNFNGSDNFIYEICDTLGACDTATVTVTINLVNDPPVAINDSANTSVNTAVLIDVAANDSDPDGNLDPTTANTTCATCSGPANGSLFNNGDGSFNYTPNSSYIGPDSFVYEICDLGGVCDTATVNITVTPTNDPPVAVDDSDSTLEDTPVTIDVAANDSDVDGNLDPASTNTACSTCTGTNNGTLANNGNGTFDYTPNPNFSGGDIFVYEICDTLGACDTATVILTVNPVNDPPVANNDSASTPEDTPVTIDVAANDIDPEGNLDATSANTTCATCTVPANGNLVNNGDGTFDYTPNLGFTGADSFMYEICDSGSPILCDTTGVSITVNPLAPTIFEVRVANESDDAEEENSSGNMDLNSSDLELVMESGLQTVGMRFNSVTIPPGATILNATIQFQVDEINSEVTALTIQGEDIDNAATFIASNGNISSRPRTIASTSWSPAAWLTVGEAGPDQQTPDIAAVVQEIVDRPGWSSGNSLAVIITGTGKRVADSYRGSPAAAPLLHVEYSP